MDAPTQPTVAILVPWRPGNADRQRLWDFTKEWWQRDHPTWSMHEAAGPIDGPFNRSAAINEAARAAGDWDVAVIIDADVIANADAVRNGVQVAQATGQLVVTHDERIMLTKNGTNRIIGGYRGPWRGGQMHERIWQDSVSCSVVVARPLWDLVGGFDELFVGWGREDTAFRIAAETLTGKPLIRLSSELFHLWHPEAPDAKRTSPIRQANEKRHQRYVEARWNQDAIRTLLAEAANAKAATLGTTTIPRILHRTVPQDTSPEVEAFWAKAQALHPGWDTRTYRDPIAPTDFPRTSHLWGRCANGAQKAGLIRLEALCTHGGIYLDSDVEPFRSLEPLLHLPAFAGWEDETTVPDAVLGAAPGHPAFEAMLTQAMHLVAKGADAWTSGPGLTTSTLPGRTDVLLLPPGSFYPHHYLEKAQAGQRTANPWVFLEHKWHHSWGTPAQRQGIADRQRS